MFLRIGLLVANGRDGRQRLAWGSGSTRAVLKLKLNHCQNPSAVNRGHDNMMYPRDHPVANAIGGWVLLLYSVQ